MKRREFITLLGGAVAAWPLAAHAQQAAMPAVGFLNPTTAEASTERVRGFLRGLRESGFVEGENVAIVYRWGGNQSERLPDLAADLVRRNVGVISASAGASLTAKAATSTIPIVFIVGEDPVKLGLVASLARPGGNATGINFFSSEVAAKRLEFLREMVPSARRIAVLVNPSFALNAETAVRETEAAARAMGLHVTVLNASSGRDIGAAFATIERERFDALFVGGDPLFSDRRVQLALSAMRHGIPATFAGRQFVEAGGLMSYGTSIEDAFRQNGVYVGRILKGAKPADLPVVQSSKFELVINAETARVLKLAVPPSLLTAADLMIE
jgi:putative ABC transport system substrate-binding protein